MGLIIQNVSLNITEKNILKTRHFKNLRTQGNDFSYLYTHATAYMIRFSIQIYHSEVESQSQD